MDTRRQIAEVERKAHQGDYGAWRRDFCRSYREVLARICRQASEEQKEYLAARGTAMSCAKGCAFCCVQYISISLAHGLLIVDYLYRNAKLIDPFLKRYGKWQRSLAGSAALQELEKYTSNSNVVRRTPQGLLDLYARYNIACPFLEQNLCTIYPVRPICCASHVSISPPEYCRSQSESQAMICEATPPEKDLRELAMLGEPMLSLHQETMPRLVFRLLIEGLPEVEKKVELLS